MTAARETIVLAQAPADCDVAGLVNDVLVITTDDPAVVIWPCPRCWDEDGTIKMYGHVAGGVCFKCYGAGGDRMGRQDAQAKAERIIKGRITRARKSERERLAKLAKRAALQAAIIAERPGLAILADEDASGRESGYIDEDTYQDEHAPLGGFVLAIAVKFRYEPHRLTANALDAVEDAIAKARARNEAQAARAAEIAAANVQIPTGRVEIRGRVLAAWRAEVQGRPYGGPETVTKIRVETPDGWVAIGTLPAKIVDALLDEPGKGYPIDKVKGRQVAFTAAVEPAREQREGELPVGFYSRPTKARLA